MPWGRDRQSLAPGTQTWSQMAGARSSPQIFMANPPTLGKPQPLLPVPHTGLEVESPRVGSSARPLPGQPDQLRVAKLRASGFEWGPGTGHHSYLLLHPCDQGAGGEVHMVSRDPGLPACCALQVHGQVVLNASHQLGTMPQASEGCRSPVPSILSHCLGHMQGSDLAVRL